MQKNINNTDVGYYPSLFVLLPFPYQNQKTNTYTKKYRDYEITFSNPEYNVPYGKYPRQLLSLITTQYTLQKNDYNDKNKARIIELGNISETAKKLNITNPYSGKKQSSLISAMGSLIYLQFITRSNKISEKYNISQITNNVLFSRAQMYWRKLKENDALINQTELFNNFVELSRDTAELFNNFVVPCDILVFNELKTARQQDLYIWSIKKAYSLKQTKKSEDFISFNNLIPQFFDKVINKTDQKDTLKKDLIEVVKYYPELNIKTSKDNKGFVILPSRLHIEEKHLGYV